MNIGKLITRHALYRPEHTAVIFENHRLTYRQFNQRVNRLANALLGLGLKKGDKLATVLGNCLELLELYQAVAKTGVVIVPLSPLLRGPGLTFILKEPGSATPAQLKAWINERVGARYQRVHEVIILEDFPRSAAGKTLKRLMREPYWADKDTKN
jgi:acyl-CoA synthetase (AMP-forming)/AMP-acid ligase II